MRLTIVRDDNVVIVDGVAMTIDCSAVADVETPGAQVHAVQWNGARGEIEFTRDPHAGNTAPVTPNRVIGNIDQFSPVIAAWTNAKAVADARRTAAVAATPVVKP